MSWCIGVMFSHKELEKHLNGRKALIFKL
jgi:hypothetical protein